MKGKGFIPALFLISFLMLNILFSHTASAQTTYSISGKVFLNSIGLKDVTMTITGPIANTTTTNILGNYTFTGLTDGTYTVTPSKTDYTFEPTSTVVHITGANESEINFTAHPVTVTYSISGSVSGDTREGVTMNLTGPITGTVTTNISGAYTFTGLTNGDYTVTPGKTGYTFIPTSRKVTINGASQTGKDFSATQTIKYSISGNVSGAVQEGITITLSGAASRVATTDFSGNYSFPELINGNYLVTPSKAGYTLSPSSTSVKIDNGDQTGVNFTSLIVTTSSISGTVTGAVQEGVTITLSGATSKVATTDSSGNYSFPELINGNYIVTPSKAGYTFSPSSTSVKIDNGDQTDVNFTSSIICTDWSDVIETYNLYVAQPCP